MECHGKVEFCKLQLSSSPNSRPETRAIKFDERGRDSDPSPTSSTLIWSSCSDIPDTPGIPTPQKKGGATNYFPICCTFTGTSWIYQYLHNPHLSLPAARPSCHGAKGSPWTKAKRRVSWASSVQPLAVPAIKAYIIQWAPGEFDTLNISNEMPVFQEMPTFDLVHRYNSTTVWHHILS